MPLLGLLLHNLYCWRLMNNNTMSMDLPSPSFSIILSCLQYPWPYHYPTFLPTTSIWRGSYACSQQSAAVPQNDTVLEHFGTLIIGFHPSPSCTRFWPSSHIQIHPPPLMTPILEIQSFRSREVPLELSNPTKHACHPKLNKCHA